MNGGNLTLSPIPMKINDPIYWLNSIPKHFRHVEIVRIHKNASFCATKIPEFEKSYIGAINHFSSRVERASKKKVHKGQSRKSSSFVVCDGFDCPKFSSK